MSSDESGLSIDELLDRAVRAINHGDRATAAALASQVLAVDRGNPEAEDLLAVSAKHGEIRRLTLMFVDLVDSTVLSTRVEPETYRTLVGRYRDEVVRLVNQYEGHIHSTKGDGLLAMFGHPKAHEDDVRRAVAAGSDITRAVARLSDQAERRFGVTLSARVGVHRGLVYLDPEENDVYGFAANFAQRIESLAEPGSVAVSDATAALVGDVFELVECPPARVKGMIEPVPYHRVVGERSNAPTLLLSTPLVGRERERTWLEKAWQEALAGRSTTPGVAFHGEPGIGKTRLAHAAAEQAQESGGTVVELRGSPLHDDAGLHPVRRLLERRCGITRFTDGPDRLRLLEAELRGCGMDPANVVPLLAPVLGVGPEHGYQPAAVEGRTLYELIGAAAHQYVLKCLGDGAGLVIAEDVHWFDPSTIELLKSMLSSADGTLMVVLTGREGPWLQNEWPVSLFELSPLSDDESDALIDALNSTVTEAQRAAVRSRCDGVPFYIEHVVAGLNEAEYEQQVPDALYEPLFARLHARNDVVPVVEAAAAIGRAGDHVLLRSVVDPEINDVEDIVAELVRARVLEPNGIDGWRFRHELLREVASELAPPSLRRVLHARAARALIEGAAGIEPDWRVVARHFDFAQRFDDAVTAYQKASIDARRRGALQEALICLTNALDRLTQCKPGPARDRAEIHIRLERGFLAGAAQGSWSGEGPADLERCLELASAGMHEDELFASLYSLIGYYHPRAELRRAHDLLDSLSQQPVTAERAWSAPALSSTLGTVLWLEGDFEAARGHLLDALDARSAADPRELATAWWVATDPISAAHNYLALTYIMSGDLDRADIELAQSVRRCEELEYPQNAFNRAMTYFHEIWVRLESSRVDEAATLVSGMRSHAEASGLDLWLWVSATQNATTKALAELSAGADDAVLTSRAENIVRRVDASRLMELNVYLTFHDAVIARLLIAAGSHDKARERLDMSLELAERSGMHFHDAELMRLRAHALAAPDAQRNALADALAFARRQGAMLFELRCLLDGFELLGDGDRSALAEVLCRFPGDARWPERVRAERILS